MSKKCLKHNISSAALSSVWPSDELRKKNIPKRCLSVHLFNIYQRWILMSNLTEKGKESTITRCVRLSMSNSDFPGAAAAAPMWTDVNLDVRLPEWSILKIPLLCSHVQLSRRRKKRHLLDPLQIRKVPKKAGLSGGLNTKYKWKQ